MSLGYVSKIQLPGATGENYYIIKDSEGRLMIAPEYSTSGDYKIGDYYVKDGKFNKVTAAGIGSTSVTETTVAEELESLNQTVAGGMHYIGVTSTELTDGDKTTKTLTPYSTGSLTKTTGFISGDVVLYRPSVEGEYCKEFIYNGSVWNLFGSETGGLKALAYKDTASGTITVNHNTYTANSISVKEYANGNAHYIKPTTVAVGVKVSGTTSASAVSHTNKNLVTGTIYGVDSSTLSASSVSKTTKKLNTLSITEVKSTSTDAVTKADATTQKLVTTSIKGVGGTTAVLSSASALTDTLDTTSIKGVAGTTTASLITGNTGVTASHVKSSTPKTFVTGSANVTVATGLTPDSSSVAGNPLTGATVTSEMLSWNTSAVATGTVKEVSGTGTVTDYTFDDVAATKVTASDVTVAVANESNTTVATGLTKNGKTSTIAVGMTSATSDVATAAASDTTVATGSVATGGSGSSVAVGVTYSTSGFATLNGTTATVATGSASDNGEGAEIDTVTITPVTGIAKKSSTSTTFATGEIGVSGTGASIVDTVTETAVGGLATAVAVDGTASAYIAAAAGETGAIKTIDGITGSDVTKTITLVGATSTETVTVTVG